jgi:hypothetical protein
MAAVEELYLTSLARCPSERSVKELAGIMSNEDAPPMARLRAAEILLDWGKGEFEELPERVEIH